MFPHIVGVELGGAWALFIQHYKTHDVVICIPRPVCLVLIKPYTSFFKRMNEQINK